MNYPALVAAIVLGGLSASPNDVTRATPDRCAEPPECRKQPKLEKGMLLVASRSLEDPNFAQTVVLLIATGQNGAMGVIINRPSELKLAAVLPDIKSLRGRREMVYLGGPVLTHHVLLLIRSAEEIRNAVAVFDDVYVSSSLTALKRELGQPDSKRLFHAYAGHAGWGAGQLEAEVGRGDWYVTPADADTVLTAKPRDLWAKLIQRVEGEWVRRDDQRRLATGSGAAAREITLAAPAVGAWRRAAASPG